MEIIADYVGNKNESAFAELVDRHGGLVYSTCYRILRNVDDSEDAAQATFAVLAQKASSFKLDLNLAAWLHGIARNISMNQIRSSIKKSKTEKKAQKEKEYSAKQDPRNEIDPEEKIKFQDRLDQAMSRLSEPLRQAVILRYLENRSLKDSARIAGCPVKTIGWRAQQGVSKLRRELTALGVGLSAGVLVSLLLSEGEKGLSISGAVLQSMTDAASKVSDSTLMDLQNASELSDGVLSQGVPIKAGIGKASLSSKILGGIAAAVAAGGIFYAGSTSFQSPTVQTKNNLSITNIESKPIIDPIPDKQNKVAVHPFYTRGYPIDGLRGYWGFETAGDARDETVFGPALKLSEKVTRDKGLAGGQALWFQKKEGSIPSATAKLKEEWVKQFPASGSFALWLKTDYEALGMEPIFGQFGGGRNQFFIRRYGKIKGLQIVFQKADLSFVFANNLTVDNTDWNHIAVIWDTQAGRGLVYFNGTLNHSETIRDSSWKPNSQYLRFGGSYSGSENYIGGMDEILLYDRPLSAKEIFNVYAAVAPKKKTSTNPKF